MDAGQGTTTDREVTGHGLQEHLVPVRARRRAKGPPPGGLFRSLRTLEDSGVPADRSKVGRAPRKAMLSAEIALGLAATVGALAFEPLRRSEGLELVGLFLALAIASDAFAINDVDRGFNISGSLVAIVLAIALTGPAGGVIVGTLSALVDGLRLRRPWSS